MKFEVGQVWRYGESYLTVTNIDGGVFSCVADDGSALEESGNDFSDDMLSEITLISSHPTFYAAIAEMGRLVEEEKGK